MKNLKNKAEKLPKREKVAYRKDGVTPNQAYWVTFENKDIRKLLDSEEFQSAPKEEKLEAFEYILQRENYNPKKSIFTPDAKLKAKNWLILNFDTGITCPNRANGRCDFCKHCYAYKACRNPSATKHQIAKAIYGLSNTAETIAEDIKAHDVRIVRIDQEGEFNDLETFLKVCKVAELCSEVRFYGYTKNYEILDYIEENEIPNNLIIRDSLSRTSKNHYLAVPEEKMNEYIARGYLVCKGHCPTCKQCLKPNKIITKLRDGSK